MEQDAKQFRLTFIGRRIGSLSQLIQWTVYREAVNEEDAILQLYDDYEHVTEIKVTEKS